jgi:hypothetical protein
MDDLGMQTEGSEAEPGADAPGTTMLLGDQGWEACEFVEPESDWSRLDDGSYVSPNGRLRTWLLTGSGPQ